MALKSSRIFDKLKEKASSTRGKRRRVARQSQEDCCATHAARFNNLQGMMQTAKVTTYTSGTASRVELSTYQYNESGIRVSAVLEIDSTADGTYETRTKTGYVNDPQNETGYSQVLVETTTDAATSEVQKRIVYTIGSGRIDQTTTTYSSGVPQSTETLTFGQDGHDSTRVLYNLLGSMATIGGVRQLFSYDSYGNAIGFNPSLAGTSFLYNCEQRDSTGLSYFRARYYRPQTGTFLSFDPATGNTSDPQSFHKYLFTPSDPINFNDPTGRFFGLLMGSYFGAFLNTIEADVGGQIINSLGFGSFSGDALSLTLDVVSRLIPDNVKAYVNKLFADVDWGFVGKIAGVTIAAGATITVGAAYAVNQTRALQAARQQVAGQVKMISQLQRICDFKDLAHGVEGKIARKEAIGMARFEQVVDRVIRPATDGDFDFLDSFFGRVQLKGPLIDPKTLKPLSITQHAINDLLESVEYHARYNSAIDAVAVDLLGFSSSQQEYFWNKLKSAELPKPVQVLW